MSSAVSSRLERSVPFVAGVLLALPTLAAHYPPMTDLPLHEGAVGLLRHFGDESYFPKALYQLNLGHPNQLFYFLALPLSYLVGTLWAVKLVVALSQFFVFAMGARLADHLGRSRWAVLLLAPLALGFTYFFGLVGNLMGFAVLLGVLPVIDRAAAAPAPRRAAVSCALLLLAFFTHESVFTALTAFALLVAIAHPLHRRATLLRMAPVLFAVVVAITHQFYAARFFTGVVVVAPMRFSSLDERLGSLGNVFVGAHDRAVQLALSALCALAAGLLVHARVRGDRGLTDAAEKPGASARGAHARELLLRHRYQLTGLGFLALYFVMPFNFRGATMVWQRFLGPAWAVLAICAGPRGPAPAPRLAKLTVSVVPLAVLLVCWPQFVDADATFRDLDRVLAAVPKNSAVALTVVERPTVHTRIYSASAGPARIVADRGGRVGLSLAMSPFAPVQLRPECRWDESDLRTIKGGLGSLEPGHDLVRFGWVIAQAPATTEARALLIVAMKPDAELVKEEGEWLLFRSTHPQLPLTSPDAPPNPRAETLAMRMAALAELRDRASSP